MCDYLKIFQHEYDLIKYQILAQELENLYLKLVFIEKYG